MGLGFVLCLQGVLEEDLTEQAPEPPGRNKPFIRSAKTNDKKMGNKNIF